MWFIIEIKNIFSFQLSSEPNYNFALLKLRSPIANSFSRPIPICDEELPEGTPLATCGLGSTSTQKNLTISNVLMETYLFETKRIAGECLSSISCRISKKYVVHKRKFFYILSYILFRGVPLCTILRYPYLVTDPLAPKYTNFKGKRATKKRCFGQNFPKSA